MYRFSFWYVTVTLTIIVCKMIKYVTVLYNIQEHESMEF